ncbi:uncharacterized protein K02A2.6-like [Ruditapes philippinarum]|uniref:uncharacterized protein K02A2.6-like n=1 Tax=Ruditapes philippinarum TaxID=129788 RepID=UPI00295AF6C1|nr:uncharacterized protein K02A2.6-like [Ruditapes philippinarum]
MDLNGVPIPTMNWDSQNPMEEFKKFRQHAELIFSGALREKEEEVQVTYLLLWIGDRGRQIYNTLTLTELQRKSIKAISDAIQKHLQPKSNPVFSRYKFHNEKQGNSTIEQFITRLKTLANDCAFHAGYRDDVIRDQIVIGITSEKVREKLITEGEALTLEKAVRISQSHEYAQAQLRDMTNSKNIDDINHKRHSTSKHQNEAGKKHNHHSRVRQNQQITKCGNCGQSHHSKDRCPARGKLCKNCHKWNHYAVVCRSNKKVHEIETGNNNSDSNSDSEFCIGAVDSHSKGQVFVDLQVGSKGHFKQFKLDTGACCNILSEADFKSLKINTPLKKPTVKLTAYSGTEIKVLGVVDLSCSYKKKCSKLVEFYVVRTNKPSILGLQACLDFNVIQIVMSVDQNEQMNKNSVLRDFPEVFHGFGKLPGACSIKVDPKYSPVIHPPRRVPVALQSKVKMELDAMEKAGIIAKVTTPTNWVNSMVVVNKPHSDKVRIVIDPKDLNKAIHRPHYPTKTLDDILPQLNSAKYFTKLDCKSGYWSVVLDDESSYLTTFNTPQGRYRYLRCPMGLKCSQDLFQQKMDECLEGLLGCCVIVDDILVNGSTREEHDINLRNLLDRCSLKGIRLNEDKLAVCVSEVKYFWSHPLS